ncbi:MAG: phosphatidate cytidylyltransferase [Chloroflexi bacterium]|nr:phosphatidate cytidylyltransferase [Chloroflexota bacterium]
MRTRLLSIAVLVPTVLCCIYCGGWLFWGLVILWLTLAEVEFWRLTSVGPHRPSLVVGLAMLWLFLLDVQFPQLEAVQPGMAMLLLVSLAWQMSHRQGNPIANWALALSGGLYLGLCGACIVRLRGLEPDGLWWTLTVLPAIVFADAGAYIIGRSWGRRKLAPRLSPGKTWEGYVGGCLVSVLLTFGITLVWRDFAGASAITGWSGLVLGVLIGALAPLGDLAISMLKRQAGVKDSGRIIPGHGGALDRIDSVLWAAVIGYYAVLWIVPLVS